MKKYSEEDILLELKKFKHKIEGQVKFHEVDSFRVVHNIQYFYFCEWARTKYLENCGVEFNKKTFTQHTPLMTVHHEMDYFHSLMLSDTYYTYTRCSKIGHSSINLDNIILDESGRVVIKLNSTLVNVDIKDNKPAAIPEDLSNKLMAFEGINLENMVK